MQPINIRICRKLDWEEKALFQNVLALRQHDTSFTFAVHNSILIDINSSSPIYCKNTQHVGPNWPSSSAQFVLLRQLLLLGLLFFAGNVPKAVRFRFMLLFADSSFVRFVAISVIFVFDGEVGHRRMVSSWMLRRVALVETDVSEEHSASFIRLTRIGELGRTLAVTSNRRTLRRNIKWHFSFCRHAKKGVFLTTIGWDSSTRSKRNLTNHNCLFSLFLRVCLSYNWPQAVGFST
jgi:hypothetical protein